jgi:hypothetical protein
MMNFVYLRSYMLKLFAFFLDSCIVNKGEKFVHVLDTWKCLEGVPIGSGNFWAVWCRASLLGRSKRPRAVRCVVGGLTALWRRSNRPGHGEQIFALCCIPVLHCCISSGGVCFGSGGACICAGGALCGIRALVRWFALFVWARFSLGCVETLPLPKGSKICLPQVILFFAFLWLSIACWGFLLFVSFPFLFSRVLYVGVVNALIKGEIEDHLRFEDRWMVASLCDEWLTMLCGLILG